MARPSKESTIPYICYCKLRSCDSKCPYYEGRQRGIEKERQERREKRKQLKQKP
jgi:hypothetical protein